jgi:glycerophosphoryl diester phosphodiesterase
MEIKSGYHLYRNLLSSGITPNSSIHKQRNDIDSMQKPLALLHRAGHHNSYAHRENTLARANTTADYPRVDGFEIDVRLTKDKVPVVHHNSQRRLTLAQFRVKKAGDTLKEWINWLSAHPKKTLYLDLKERVPVDELARLIEPCHRRIWIGSRDPAYVVQLVRMKRISKFKTMIFYMTWNSIFAQSQVWLAEHYFRKHNAKPDGIHAMYEEIAPVGLRWLHLKLVKRLVLAAKKRGYLVSGGTGHPKSVRRMMRYGVDCLMPNHHDHIPEQ